MRNILLVIKHEILTTLGKRSFWIMTFLFPALVIAFSFGSQVVAEKSFEGEEQELWSEDAAKLYAIGYVDEIALIEALPPGLSPGLLQPFPDEAAAQAALEAGEVEQYYLIPSNFIESGELVLVDSEFSPFGSMVESNLFEYVVKYNLVGDEKLTNVLMDPTPLVENIPLAPQGGTDTSSPASFSYWIPYATLFVFFFVITMTSGFMLQSVAQEKENRTVEVLLLSLRPRELMLGKVVGLGVVALLQMTIWGGGGLLMMDRRLGLVEAAAALTLPPGFVAWAALYFVLGYLLYASILGAIGALAPTAREGTQFTFIAMLPLMIPMWLNNVFAQTPNGSLATFLSFFPLTAPVSMVTRLVAGGVPTWQPAVGLLGLAATTYLFVLLAARFFRADTLLSSAGLDWQRIVREFRK